MFFPTIGEKLMRRIVSTSMILAASLIAMPAMGGSITTISGLAESQPSILVVDCADCPALKPEAGKKSYQVPTVPAGSQTAEVVDVDGEKKLKRVESWLGGSPVVLYTSAAGWTTNGSTIIAGALPTASEVDHSATTAAVGLPSEEKVAPVTAGMELRLN